MRTPTMLVLAALIFSVSIAFPDVLLEIRQSAMAPNSETDHPLPLAGSWDAGNCGYRLEWQLQQIKMGHHLLPWVWFADPGTEVPYGTVTYRKALLELASLHLPFVMVGKQWEEVLYTDPGFFALPPLQNANVISAKDGSIQKKISPFGAVNTWRLAGRMWTTDPLIQKFQQWYRDPPRVIFLSNNEAVCLRIWEADQDRRYVELYGLERNDNFKRRVFYDEGWRPRYNALKQGLLDGLDSRIWRANARFIAFNAVGPWWFGMYKDWQKYSSYIPNRIEAAPTFWDGGSEEVYQSPGDDMADFKVYSPQIHAMNLPFIVAEALRLNPYFWFEFSTWDGDDKKRKWYASIGQKYSPERYGGMVQFNMWITRPRVVREYHDSCSVVPWMDPIIAAVDRVYQHPVLERFWRSGKLVANPTRPHPYQSDVPVEYRSKERMFLLSTNLDPPLPWRGETVLPVFALARVIGAASEREWLLYVFTPIGDRRRIQITIPGYRDVTADGTVGGAFYVISEKNGTVLSAVSNVFDVVGESRIPHSGC